MCAMLNRRGLARRLSKRALFSIREADLVIDELAKVIAEELYNGNDVCIVGFGKFFLYEHSARPVRNPKTKEEMTLKPYKSVKFRPSTRLKETLKEKHDGSKPTSAFEFPEELEEFPEDYDSGDYDSEE